MTSILETLNIDDLILRKDNLLKQLNKVNEEIKKKSDSNLTKNNKQIKIKKNDIINNYTDNNLKNNNDKTTNKIDKKIIILKIKKI